MIIDDGRGRGHSASVSDVNRLNVSAKSQERIFFISRDDGLAFNAISTIGTATAADIVFYLKNTSSTRNMYISRIEFHALNAAVWKVFTVTGTASGTAITPSNLNRTTSKVAEATCAGSGAVTGLTTVDQIGTHRTTAGSEGEMTYHGSLILGPNDAIAVEYDTGTAGAAEVDCFFWYESISRDA